MKKNKFKILTIICFVICSVAFAYLLYIHIEGIVETARSIKLYRHYEQQGFMTSQAVQEAISASVKGIVKCSFAIVSTIAIYLTSLLYMFKEPHIKEQKNP